MRAFSVLFHILFGLAAATGHADAVPPEAPREILIRCTSAAMVNEVWFYLSADGHLVVDSPEIPRASPRGDVTEWKRLFAPETVSRIASADFDLYAEAPLSMHLSVALAGYNRFFPILPGQFHRGTLEYVRNGLTVSQGLQCLISPNAGLSRF